MNGAITLDTAWLLSVLLLALRLSGVLLFTPVLGQAGVPVRVRVLLLLALAAVLALALPGPVEAGRAALGGPDAGAMIGAALSELALGATLALGIQLAFAAFSVAGSLLGTQIGFGLGRAMDPTSATGAPILASALDQLAVVGFFSVDGHHVLLRGVARSLERFPLGSPWSPEAAHAPIVRQFSAAFGLGFALAAPVVFFVLLVELSLGIVARSLPQVNMLALGIPVKIVLGLVALALWAAGLGDVMGRVYASVYRTWDALFAAAAGGVGRAVGAC